MTQELVRRLRNVWFGLLTLALLPLTLLISYLGLMAVGFACVCFLVPAVLTCMCLGLVAPVVWLLLAVPSLVVRGDFTWPCASAKAIGASGVAWVDRINASDRVGEAFDRSMGGVCSLWSAYGRVARRVEGC